jgi:hypothetical protein
LAVNHHRHLVLVVLPSSFLLYFFGSVLAVSLVLVRHICVVCSIIRILFFSWGSVVQISESVLSLDLLVVLDHDCSVAGGCSSFTINPPSQLSDRCRRKDRGGIVVVLPVVVVCAGLFRFSLAFCLFGC